MSGFKHKSSTSMQQPPAEEAEIEVSDDPRRRSATINAAWRLSAANWRERQARSAQVEGVVERITSPNSVKPLWRAVARTVLRGNISNFERFIHAQYKHTARDSETLGLAPNPGSFETQKGISRYRNYNRHADRSLAQDKTSAALEFKCAVSDAGISYPRHDTRQLWRLVLMNTILDLTPLFRYCVAYAEQIDHPQEFYRSAAMAQFMTDPIGYSRVWGDWIPKELKEAAEVILMIKLEAK